MTARQLASSFIWVVFALSNACAFAQSWPDYLADPSDPHAFDRGPGGYLAWWKLLIVAVVFIAWVKLADWMNVDAQRTQARTRILAVWWNPIVVGAFVLGFLTVLVLPVFWIGLPVYGLTAFAPFVTYVVMRNSRMPAHQAIFTTSHLSRRLKGEQQLVEQSPEDEAGPPLRFEAGGDVQQAQINLIRARQSANMQILKSLLYDAIASRADTLMAQRTVQGVQWRKCIDGVWHLLPAMDREIGEATVAGLKYLSNIDPTNPTAPPSGHFLIRSNDGPRRCETAIDLQRTSEQLSIRLVEQKKPVLKLDELGMFPENAAKLREKINSPGMVIVSAIPGAGLTTTWVSVLTAADRVSRDWVAIVDHDENDTRIENVEVNRYDSRRGQSPMDLMRSILLKQPESLVLPKIPDATTMDAMTQQILKERRTVITRTPARSAAEAMLRVAQIAGRRQDFIQAVTAVTGQRLVRRLCDQCKQPMPSTPEMIKQMGGDPANPPTIYKQYAKPEPPPVDKKGRPIEIPPCRKCAGFGYYGRIALVELIEVDDAVRNALAQQPDLHSITNLALNKRRQSALHQGYRHVLEGTTSLAEIQRVFKANEKTE